MDDIKNDEILTLNKKKKENKKKSSLDYKESKTLNVQIQSILKKSKKKKNQTKMTIKN